MENLSKLIGQNGLIDDMMRSYVGKASYVHPTQEAGVAFDLVSKLKEVMRHVFAENDKGKREFVLAYYYARNYLTKEIYEFILKYLNVSEENFKLICKAFIAYAMKEERRYN